MPEVRLDDIATISTMQDRLDTLLHTDTPIQRQIVDISWSILASLFYFRLVRFPTLVETSSGFKICCYGEVVCRYADDIEIMGKVKEKILGSKLITTTSMLRFGGDRTGVQFYLDSWNEAFSVSIRQGRKLAPITGFPTCAEALLDLQLGEPLEIKASSFGTKRGCSTVLEGERGKEKRRSRG